MENDLISRSALKKALLDRSFFPAIVKAALENAPAVDAVEVVRCKDCKHKKHLQGARDEAIVCGLGWGLSGIVAKEDFCSYGKRRGPTDETNCGF